MPKELRWSFPPNGYGPSIASDSALRRNPETHDYHQDTGLIMLNPDVRYPCCYHDHGVYPTTGRVEDLIDGYRGWMVCCSICYESEISEDRRRVALRRMQRDHPGYMRRASEIRARRHQTPTRSVVKPAKPTMSYEELQRVLDELVGDA